MLANIMISCRKFSTWKSWKLLHTPDMPSENLVTSLPGYHPWQPVSHSALKLTRSYYRYMLWCIPGSVFCLLLWVNSDYAQPITGQITEVTCPVIGRVQPELTPSKRQKTGPGLYSLSGKPRYWMLQWSYRSEIWQAPRQQRCRGTCQISERLEKFKPESRGFETSRDLAVRRLTA